MTDNNNNNRDKIRIHEDIAILKTQVSAILTNHLPHLRETIDTLSNKFWAVIILLVANLVGLVVTFFKMFAN